MAAISLHGLHRFPRRGLDWQNNPGAAAKGAAAASLLRLPLLPSRFALAGLPLVSTAPETAALQMPASPASSWQLPRQLLESSHPGFPAWLRSQRGQALQAQPLAPLPTRTRQKARHELSHAQGLFSMREP